MALLIADSGSTKTDWRLVDTDGQTHAIQTDGLNPYYQSTAQMTETLREQLVPQVADATVRKVFFYGTGCTGPAVNHIVADSVQAILPGLQVVEVNSDMLGAARGATGHEPGIVCTFARSQQSNQQCHAVRCSGAQCTYHSPDSHKSTLPCQPCKGP